MKNIALNLWNEEAGFVISAELVLVSTIAVLAMVVGLSEVAFGVVQELEDTGSAFASINQTFRYSGICGHTGMIAGTCFTDVVDFCDQAGSITPGQATAETTSW
jgi:hypothetical protein